MLPLASLDDYLTDLSSVIGSLDQPPVLIGHSMGGMVVQRYVERLDRKLFRGETPTPVAGMALLAALSPSGLATTATQLMLSDPLVFFQLSALQTFGEHAVMPEGVHRAMFARSTPVAMTRKYMPRMQAESQRVQLDLMMGAPPWPANALCIPRLVIGAQDDPFVPPWMSRMTARHYSTEAHILTDSGHAMMLGPDWETPARIVLDWLMENGI
jgi:pimeloyl-ACP methyl ester carboxylesterase